MAVNPTLTTEDKQEILKNNPECARPNVNCFGSISTGLYRGEQQAKEHRCVGGDPPIHKEFWSLAYRSAYQVVNRTFVPSYGDDEGRYLGDYYLDGKDIKSVEVTQASFGDLREGWRRVLSLELRLRVEGLDGFVHFGIEGTMDEETCEITWWRTWE